MLTTLRRHPYLSLTAGLVVVLLVLFVGYSFTPTYIGALLGHH